MSGERSADGGDGGIDAEVEDALRSVARPKARSEFREDLREQFLSAAENIPHSPRPASSETHAAPERRSGRRWIGALFAAGSILALGYYLLQPAAPGWRVLEITPGSVVEVDGISMPVEDPAALASSLQGAKEIEVVSGGLVLQIGDLSLFDLDQGTRVAFQGFDRNDSDVPIQVRASSGRLRARTGPDFRGRTMRIQTDLMDVLVTGTAFAVDYEAHGTCVCCLHGVVQISSKALGPDPKPIPPEQMCLIYRSEHDPKSKSGGHPEHHTKPLRNLEERARTIWP